jgi:hypothetical protein
MIQQLSKVFNNTKTITDRELNNAIRDIKELVAQANIPALNTWDVPGVAFVDPLAGVGAGTVGDGNDPFPSVSAADEENPDAIFLLPGNYSETVSLSSGMTYFSYPGVTFVDGGLRADVAQDGTRWLGYASFIGNYRMIYFKDNEGQALENMEIEFDVIEETGSASRCILIDPDEEACNIVMKGRKVTSFGGNGHGIRLQDNANVDLFVTEGIYGPYGPLNTFNLTGTCTVNTPKIVATDRGFGGNVAGFKAAVWNQLSSGGTLIVNGDVIQETTPTIAGAASTGNVASAVHSSGSGNVIINGTVDGGQQRGISHIATGYTIVNGNVKSAGDHAFEATAGSLLIESSSVFQNESSILSGTGKVWLNGCQVFSEATDHIIDVTNNSNELYIHNTVLEGSSDSALCVEHNETTATIGFSGTSSNLANSALTDAYSPTGFVQQTGIRTPDFI